MKLHSYTGLITNSSTITYAMAVNEEGVYNLLQNVMEVLGITNKTAKDVFKVKEEIDKTEFKDWIIDHIIEGMDEDDLKEEYGLLPYEEYSSYNKYRKKLDETIERMIKDGTASAEEYKKEKSNSYGYNSYYKIRLNENDSTVLDLDAYNLFNIEGSYDY